jgi:Na+/phosphate symporter
VNTLEATLSMAMSVVGGLGIFMLGMKYMSEGMQAVAGNSLRRMISLVTDHRLMATAVGTGVTVLVQSSSITTVIVVGLVNAGLMQLHQAIGVIMGANIGTTITGWILVLKLGQVRPADSRRRRALSTSSPAATGRASSPWPSWDSGWSSSASS